MKQKGPGPMQSADFLTGKVEKNAVMPVANFCLCLLNIFVCLYIYFSGRCSSIVLLDFIEWTTVVQYAIILYFVWDEDALVVILLDFHLIPMYRTWKCYGKLLSEGIGNLSWRKAYGNMTRISTAGCQFGVYIF